MSEEFGAEALAAVALLMTYTQLIADEAPRHEIAAVLQELKPLLDSLPEPHRSTIGERLRAAESRALSEMVNPSPTVPELLAQMEAAFAKDAPRQVIQDLRQAIKRERKGDEHAPAMERANEIIREMNKRRGIS